MTPTGLREALHEVAVTGTGPHATTRAADLGTGARSLVAARRRRLAVAGSVAVAASAVVVAMVLVFAVLSPARVEPATGPGSLPDQVFPPPSQMLTVQQSPLGRAALAYSGPTVNGSSGYVVVGADEDTYRFVPSGYNPPEGLVLSPDGTQLALAVSRDTSPFGLSIVSLETGRTRDYWLPDRGLGGTVDQLAWSSDSSRIAVVAGVTDSIEGGGASGHTQYETVDLVTGAVESLAEPPNADVLLGWTATGTVLVAGSGASGRRWHALELTNDSADVVGRSASSATVRLWNHSQNFQFSYDPNRGRIGFVVDSPGVRQRDPQPRDADVVVISVNDGAVEQRHPLGTIWWGAAVVGWTTDGSPVVNELPAVEGATDATQPLVRSAQLVVPTDASTVPLVTSPLVSDEKSVIVIQPAADVLAGGEVRQAQPPYQPWYDPRTLVPQLLRSPAALVAIAAVVLAGGFLVRSVLSRRQRRKAVSRSGS